MRDDLRDFGIGPEGGANVVGHFLRSLERDVLLHVGTNPEVPLFQGRHEFSTDKVEDDDGAAQSQEGDDPRNAAEAKSAGETTVVMAAKESAQPCFLRVALDVLRNSQRSKYGSEDEREDERASQRESIGDGHGREDLSGNALHGKEWNESDEDDECRKKDGSSRVGDAGQNDVENLFALDAARDLTIDALQNHDGCVDENTEIDGANRNQIRGLIRKHHQAKREENCERDGDGRDEGDAPVTQHAQQYQRDQGEPQENDMAHGCGGDVNEIGAVVDGTDVHAGRQQIPMVQVVDLLVKGGKRGEGFCALLQQHDCLHNIGVVVVAEVAAPDLAEARLMTFLDVRHVAQQDRNSIPFGHDDIAHVIQ